MAIIERKAGRKISVKKEVAEMDRLRRSYERKLEARLKRFFVRQGNEFAEHFLATGDVANPNQLSETILPILSAHYREIMLTFGQRVLDKLEIKFDFDTLYSRYMMDFGGERIRNISGWTQSLINLQLTRGAQEGLGNAQIAKSIREVARDMSKRRAAVIARTETHNASSYAHHQMHKEFMPVNTVKQWVSTSDARTRSGHAAMNGKEVGIDEDFQVPTNGVLVPMNYAGDPRGGAANVVNCRCTVIYIAQEDDVVEQVSQEPMVSDEPWLYKDGIKPTASRELLSTPEYSVSRGPSYLMGKDIVRDNGLTSDEVGAIYAYTDFHYRAMNGFLRAWFRGEDRVPNADSGAASARGKEVTDSVKSDLLWVNNTIRDGLKKLPKYRGTVTRGIDLPNDFVEQFMANHNIKAGAIYRAESIMSTGRGNKGWEGNIKFEIESKSGRYVDELSANSGEQEVLFPAGHTFKIIEVERRQGTGFARREEVLIRMVDLQDDVKNQSDSYEVKSDWPEQGKVSRKFLDKMTSQFGLASIDGRLITTY